MAEGIRFAADNGAQVINLSLGGPIKSKILEEAVEHALSKGVLVVAAAGNSGRSVGWPAAYPGVVAVSATDDKDKIAWFSSRGPEVAIAAPGVAVTQQTVCNGGKDKCEIFGTFNGTSMASPHVAGIAAMIEALGVTDPGAVRDVAHGHGAAEGRRRTLYGAGIVDAGAAASRVFWTHFALRVARAARPRRRWSRGASASAAARSRRTSGRVAGAARRGVGLLPFAPLLGLAAYAGSSACSSSRMRPLGEWDLVLLGAGVHRWLLLASALPALALTMVAFANKRVRPLIGGLALGTAALLTQHHRRATPRSWAAPCWPAYGSSPTAPVCLWLARTALDAKRS